MKTYNILIIFTILIVLILTLKNVKANNRKTQAIYISKAKELIKKNHYDYIIDVRDEEEWNKDRLIASINIPLEKIYDGVQL